MSEFTDPDFNDGWQCAPGSHARMQPTRPTHDQVIERRATMLFAAPGVSNFRNGDTRTLEHYVKLTRDALALAEAELAAR